MKITVSDQFRNDFMKRLGIKPEHAADAVRYADRKEVVSIGDHQTHYFLRRVPVARNGSHLLVYGTIDDDTLTLNRALRVYPDIHPSFSTLRPSEVLEAVCEKFGREISVGDRKGRFIISESMKFDIPPGNRPDDPLGQVFTVHEGPMKDVVVEMLYKQTKIENAWAIEVALAFCLDVGRYDAWAKSHSGK